MTAADIRRIARAALGGLFCALLALPLPAQTLEEVAARDPLSSATLFDPSAVPEVPGPAAVTLPSGDVRVDFGGGLKVFFVNVGQGDAEYIELPDGSNALIDGGPTQGAIQRFLEERGVTHISRVVLTHPHSDHYNGLKYVFDRVQVDTFYDTRLDNSGATGDDVVRAKAASDPARKIYYPAPGDTLSWGAGTRVRVFNSCPTAFSASEGHDVNDCSIVLKVSYGASSALFMGDAQADVESQILSRFRSELYAQVLKVGHHGSAYSSSTEFLAAVHPQRAYISVGKNSYGHPTQSAMDRLVAAGAMVLRTDQNGTMAWDPSTGSNFLSAAFPSKN